MTVPGRSVPSKSVTLDLKETLNLFCEFPIASLDESCTKNVQKGTRRPKVFRKLLFSPLFCMTHFVTASPSEKAVLSFHEVQS